MFAFAMTLLVLDIASPATQQSANHLLDALLHQWPGYLGYLIPSRDQRTGRVRDERIAQQCWKS